MSRAKPFNDFSYGVGLEYNASSYKQVKDDMKENLESLTKLARDYSAAIKVDPDVDLSKLVTALKNLGTVMGQIKNSDNPFSEFVDKGLLNRVSALEQNIESLTNKSDDLKNTIDHMFDGVKDVGKSKFPGTFDKMFRDKSKEINTTRESINKLNSEIEKLESKKKNVTPEFDFDISKKDLKNISIKKIKEWIAEYKTLESEFEKIDDIDVLIDKLEPLKELGTKIQDALTFEKIQNTKGYSEINNELTEIQEEFTAKIDWIADAIDTKIKTLSKQRIELEEELNKFEEIQTSNTQTNKSSNKGTTNFGKLDQVVDVSVKPKVEPAVWANIINKKLKAVEDKLDPVVLKATFAKSSKNLEKDLDGNIASINHTIKAEFNVKDNLGDFEEKIQSIDRSLQNAKEQIAKNARFSIGFEWEDGQRFKDVAYPVINKFKNVPVTLKLANGKDFMKAIKNIGNGIEKHIINKLQEVSIGLKLKNENEFLQEVKNLRSQIEDNLNNVQVNLITNGIINIGDAANEANEQVEELVKTTEKLGRTPKKKNSVSTDAMLKEYDELSVKVNQDKHGLRNTYGKDYDKYFSDSKRLEYLINTLGTTLDDYLNAKSLDKMSEAAVKAQVNIDKTTEALKSLREKGIDSEYFAKIGLVANGKIQEGSSETVSKWIEERSSLQSKISQETLKPGSVYSSKKSDRKQYYKDVERLTFLENNLQIALQKQVEWLSQKNIASKQILSTTSQELSLQEKAKGSKAYLAQDTSEAIKKYNRLNDTIKTTEEILSKLNSKGGYLKNTDATWQMVQLGEWDNSTKKFKRNKEDMSALLKQYRELHDANKKAGITDKDNPKLKEEYALRKKITDIIKDQKKHIKASLNEQIKQRENAKSTMAAYKEAPKDSDIKKVVPVEPKMEDGAVAQEVKENVAKTPAKVVLTPEEKEAEKKLKETIKSQEAILNDLNKNKRSSKYFTQLGEWDSKTNSFKKNSEEVAKMLARYKELAAINKRTKAQTQEKNKLNGQLTQILLTQKKQAQKIVDQNKADLSVLQKKAKVETTSVKKKATNKGRAKTNPVAANQQVQTIAIEDANIQKLVEVANKILTELKSDKSTSNKKTVNTQASKDSSASNKKGPAVSATQIRDEMINARIADFEKFVMQLKTSGKELDLEQRKIYQKLFDDLFVRNSKGPAKLVDSSAIKLWDLQFRTLKTELGTDEVEKKAQNKITKLYKELGGQIAERNSLADGSKERQAIKEKIKLIKQEIKEQEKLAHVEQSIIKQAIEDGKREKNIELAKKNGKKADRDFVNEEKRNISELIDLRKQLAKTEVTIDYMDDDDYRKEGYEEERRLLLDEINKRRQKTPESAAEIEAYNSAKIEAEIEATKRLGSELNKDRELNAKKEADAVKKVLGIYQQIGAIEAEIASLPADSEKRRSLHENISYLEKQAKQTQGQIKIENSLIDSYREEARIQKQLKLDNKDGAKQDTLNTQERRKAISDLIKNSEKLGKLNAEINDTTGEKKLEELNKHKNELIDIIKEQQKSLGVDKQIIEARSYAAEVEEARRRAIKKADEYDNREIYGSSTIKKAQDLRDAIAGKTLSEEFIGSKSIESELNNVNIALTNLINKQQQFKDSNPAIEEKEEFKLLVDQYEQAYLKLDKIIKSSRDLANQAIDGKINQVNLDATDIEQVKTNLIAAAQSFDGASIKVGKFDEQLKQLEYRVKQQDGTWANFIVQLNQAGTQIVGLRGKVKKLDNIFTDFFTGSAQKFKNAMQVFSGYDLFFEGIAQVRQGIQYIRDINTALTELKKVTDETEESYAEFLQTASKTAKVVGSTVKDITTMTAEWARLGYSMQEAASLAESTAVLLNVSEFSDATEASEALISTIQAYGYAANESMDVVNVLNEVGNNFAISSDGLATALQTSASALMAAGNDLNQSVALVAAANKVLQDPSVAGAALRTISLRIRGTSLKVLEEMGEETDGVVESVSKLQEKVKAISGVDILDDSGAYRDTYDILVDLAKVWEEIGQKDPKGQAALLELLAGKNRSNALAAILTNLDDLKGAYKAALIDSEDSAMRELQTYMDSIEGRVSVFTNAVQTMWMNAINSDQIKWFVDAGTSIVNILDGMVRTIKPIPTLFTLAATAFGLWKGAPKLLSTVIKSVSGLGAAIKAVRVEQAAYTAAQTASNIVTGSQLANLVAVSNAKISDTGITWLATQAEEAVTVAKIKSAMASGALSKADGIAMLSTMGLAGSVKALWAAFLASPLAPVIAALGALAVVIGVIDATTTSFKEAKEQLKETSEELETARSEIKSLNDELETIKERIDELNGKETLTIAEQEELDKLIAQNKELERQIRLEEQREKILAKQQASDLHETMEKDSSMQTQTFTTTEEDGTRITTTIDPAADRLTSQYERQKKMVEDAQEKFEDAQAEYKNVMGTDQETFTIWDKIFGTESDQKNALDAAEKALENAKAMLAGTEKDIAEQLKHIEETYGSAEWQTGDNLEPWQEALNEDLEVIYEAQYKLAMATDETGQMAEDAFNWVASRDDVGEFVDKVKEIENLDITNIAEIPGFEEFIQELIDVGFIADDTPASIQKIIDAFNVVEEKAKSTAKAVDDSNRSFSAVIGVLSSFEGGMNDLSGAYNEFIENGVASATTLEGLKETFNTGDMIDEYENFARVLSDSNSTSDDAITAIENLATAYIESLDLTAVMSEEDVNAIITNLKKLGVTNAEEWVNEKYGAYLEIRKLYGVDLNNYANAEEAKLAIAQQQGINLEELERLEMEYLANAYGVDLTNFASNEEMKSFIASERGISIEELEGEVNEALAEEYGVDLSNYASNAAKKMAIAKEVAKAAALEEKNLKLDTWVEENINHNTAEGNLSLSAYDNYYDKVEAEYQQTLKDIGDLEEGFGDLVDEYYQNIEGSGPLNIDPYQFKGLGGSGADDALAELDWIDHYFTAIDNRIAANEAKLEDTLANVANITKRNDIINAIISDYKKKIPQIEDVIDEYSLRAQQLYNSFSPDIKQKINSGSLKISEYDDELADQIQTYFDYIGQKSDWEIEIANLNITIDDYELQKFNNVVEAYENELNLEADFNNRVQSKIDLLEEQGERVSEELYKAMIRGTNTQLNTLREERTKLQNQLNAAMANGIEKGSTQWYEMVTAINDVDAAIIEAETDLESFNNAIQDLHWEAFDKLIDRISSVADEAENLRDLLDTEKVLKNNFAEGYLDGLTELDEKLKEGKISVDEYTKEYDKLAATFKDAYGWTADGVTALGLLTQEMENAKYRSNLYAEEIKDLTANYKDLGYSEDEYQEKLQELKDGQWDAIDAYESAKDAVLELNEARVEEIKDGIQKQIDAYEKLIEKQKESLQQQREQHEMAKEDKEYDDAVASIQRKLRAMQNDTSASSIAQQKALRAELAELEEERRETEYERDMDAKEQALDDSLDLYTEGKEALMDAWDDYLTHEEKVMADSYASVTNSVEAIQVKIKELSDHYGVQISDAVTQPWKDAQLTLDDYSSKFEDATSTYITKLGTIKTELESLEAQANKTANAFLAMLEAQAKEVPKVNLSGGAEPSDGGKKPDDKTPSGGGGNNDTDKTPSKGSTVTVSADATNFSSKSGNAHMASFVPGGSYTVMQTSGNQVLIGKGGVATGWVDKSDLNGYATGTLGTKKNELAWVDENGLEEIVMHAQNGRLAYLTKGSSVIPHDISENLMELGKVDPKTWLDNNRPTSVPASFVTQNNKIDLQFGTMINIERADKDSIPEIKDAVQKQLDSYMKTINNGIKRYSR